MGGDLGLGNVRRGWVSQGGEVQMTGGDYKRGDEDEEWRDTEMGTEEGRGRGDRDTILYLIDEARVSESDLKD